MNHIVTAPMLLDHFKNDSGRVLQISVH